MPRMTSLEMTGIDIQPHAGGSTKTTTWMGTEERKLTALSTTTSLALLLESSVLPLESGLGFPGTLGVSEAGVLATRGIG